MQGGRRGDLIKDGDGLAERGLGTLHITVMDRGEEGLDLILDLALTPVVQGVALDVLTDAFLC